MKRIKQIIFFLAIAIVVNWVCHILESVEFIEFLKSKLIEFLITIMAINTATVSVVVAKLHEIQTAEKISLEKTIREVKISLVEQIALIATTCILFILYKSPILKDAFKYHEMVFNTLFLTIFIYALDILRDTGIAIFVIIRYPKNKDKPESKNPGAS